MGHLNICQCEQRQHLEGGKDRCNLSHDRYTIVQFTELVLGDMQWRHSGNARTFVCATGLLFPSVPLNLFWGFLWITQGEGRKFPCARRNPCTSESTFLNTTHYVSLRCIPWERVEAVTNHNTEDSAVLNQFVVICAEAQNWIRVSVHSPTLLFQQAY